MTEEVPYSISLTIKRRERDSFLNFSKYPIEFICYILKNSSVTVQKQRTVLFFHCVRIPQYCFMQNKKALTCVNAFLFWRRMGDSNPRARKGKRFSRPPRYDHFDNPPCLLSRRDLRSGSIANGKRIHCAVHRRSRSNPPCPYDFNIISYLFTLVK